MAGKKIKLKDQLGRVINVPAATTPAAAVTPSVTQPETARPAVTVWKLIREIPANIQKLAKLVGTGFTTRGPDGEWYQRSIEPGEGIEVVDGNGVDGNPTVALAELANAGGGTLQKTLRDDYGRVAGTSAATTTDLSEGGNLYYTDLRVDARISAQKGAANGLATLDSGAKLPANQLPALAITDTFVVASQSAMLALAAERGDVAVRTDLQKSFILTAEPAATLANWQELLVPTGNPGTVTSVALSVPTGLSVAGAPITSSGTFTVTYASGYQGYLTTEATKLSGIATGATVGATWGGNLSGIPTNVASWAGIDPSVKADDSAVVHKTGVESIGGAKTFNWQIVVNPDTAAPNGTAAIQINDVAGTAARLQSDSIGPFSFIGRRYMTSLSSPTAVPDGTEIFSLSCAAYDGSSIGGATGIFSFFADGNQSTSNHGCYANIRMTPNGSTSRGTYYWLRTTAFFGGTDNFQALGDAALRWSVVYAGTGTINTSDAREKTTVRPFTPAELAAAAELGREIGVYQWLAMVEAKGNAARQHIGLTVQRAIAILESHGLDPFTYGFVCYDEWDELPEVVNEEGEVVQEPRPAGDRYSFRMDELLAFIARGMAHRLDAVEQRLATAGL